MGVQMNGEFNIQIGPYIWLGRTSLTEKTGFRVNSCADKSENTGPTAR